MNDTQKRYFAAQYAESSDIRAIIAPNTGLGESDLSGRIANFQEGSPSLENMAELESLNAKRADLAKTRLFFNEYGVENESDLRDAMIAILENKRRA